jgi:hypothetical protein
MPRSYHSVSDSNEDEEDGYRYRDEARRDKAGRDSPPSPLFFRRPKSAYASATNVRARVPTQISPTDERTGLLESSQAGTFRSYQSMPGSVPETPRPFATRHSEFRRPRHHSRKGSFSQRLVNALGAREDDAGGKHGPELLTYLMSKMQLLTDAVYREWPAPRLSHVPSE